MLVRRGLLGERQLAEALQAQRLQGSRLGSLLIRAGLVGEDEVARCLGEQLGAPPARASQLDGLSRGVIALLPRPLAERYRAVPLRLHGNELQVCLADPHDFTTLDELAFAVDCRVRAFVASEASIDLALERHYQIRRRLAPTSGEAVDGWRELGGAPEPPVAAPPPFDPLPPPPPADPAVIDQLAAAMCEGDVEAAFYRYFSERFRQVALVVVRGGCPVLVRADRKEVRLAPAPNPLRAGGLLARLLAEGQVNHQPRLTDPEVLDLCRQVGVPATNVTLVSICASDGGRYAVIGQGRDGASVRRMFPDLRAFASKAVTALQILTLRKTIRGG